MKKIRFLFLLLLVFAFCGCQTSEQISSGLDSAFGSQNLVGQTLTVSTNDGLSGKTYLGYNTGSYFGDMAMKRVMDVEEKFNCKLNMINEPDLASQLLMHSAAGSSPVDFAIMENFDRTLPRSGLLCPISELSGHIDYSDSAKWGAENLLTSLVWDGKLYGVIPVSWPEYNLTVVDFAIVSNTDAIRSSGHTDPREYVENGDWTREKFAECVNDYYSKVLTTSHYGLGVYDPHFYEMALYSSGACAAIETDNGWISGIHTAEGQEALEWARKFLNVTCKYSVFHSDDPAAPGVQLFNEGLIKLLLCRTTNAFFSNDPQYEKTFSYDIENYGIIPFPTAPNIDSDYWAGIYESAANVLVFPVLSESKDVAAMIANEIFEPFENYPTSSLDKLYLDTLFFDVRDVELMSQFVSNCSYSFADEGLRYISQMCSSENKSIAQILEATEEVYQTYIDENIAPVMDSLGVVFK